MICFHLPDSVKFADFVSSLKEFQSTVYLDEVVTHSLLGLHLLHLCSCTMWDYKERPFISPKTCSISSQCIRKQALYTQLSRIQTNVQSA
jgi:hypothetical protein